MNSLQLPRYKIGVIGGGVSGITAAYYLSRQHDVTLIEAQDRLGGHTNTKMVTDSIGGEIPVDTGFIVCNDTTYPLFHQLLSDLDVPVRNADMSFGFYDEGKDFGYAPTSFAGLVPRWSHLLNREYRSLWISLSSFHAQARSDLESGVLRNLTLKEYLAFRKYSEALIDLFIVPMGGAIWSSGDESLLETPAETFIGFFKNHGLLSFFQRPQWQTLVGGSHAYLRAFKDYFSKLSTADVFTGSPVRGIERSSSGVHVKLQDDKAFQFDVTIVALHADKVLPLLQNPQKEEKTLFEPWRYHKNHTVLHTDVSYLPPDKKIWASWNYRRELGENGCEPLSVTYHMNRLQGLRAADEYCVTLNPRRHIEKQKVLYEVYYEHPMYTIESVKTQTLFSRFNGSGDIFYVGSYQGYGFHEDAVRSTHNAIRHLLGPASVEFEERRRGMKSSVSGETESTRTPLIH